MVKPRVRRKETMICRVWHGWTSPENADSYESLLKTEIFTGIQNRQLKGYHGIHLGRRSHGDEVEFVTIMWFDSIDSVREFAGKDHEIVMVPEKVRALLSHFNARSQHYDVKAELLAN